MQAFLIVVNVFLILVALALVVAVLMQQGNTANLGAISGGAETFFGKNKAKSYEGKLALITKICAGLFIVLAITATALTSRLNNTNASAAQTPPVVATEAPVANEETPAIEESSATEDTPAEDTDNADTTPAD